MCFDEVAGISFDQKEGVNIMKGYMAAGEFSRGKESIRAEGSLVLVGNFDVSVEQQQRIGHLLSPLPKQMRHDTAFHDRIHGYVPGWDFPKLNPNEHLTDHFGLVNDFLSACWTKLRDTTRLPLLQNRVFWGGALSGRDIEAVHKTVSGLIKLLFPDPNMEVADDDLEWMVRLALESRRRVKEQQKRCLKAEFRSTHFSYTLGVDGTEQFVATPELRSDEAIDSDPLPPGQVWAIGPGMEGTGPGLYRIEVVVGPGAGATKILNQPVPPAFRESVNVGEQNLYAAGRVLVGDRDARAHRYNRANAAPRQRQVGHRAGTAGARGIGRGAVGEEDPGGDHHRGPLASGGIARAGSRPDGDGRAGGGQASDRAPDAGRGAPRANELARRCLDEGEHRVLRGCARRGVQGVGVKGGCVPAIDLTAGASRRAFKPILLEIAVSQIGDRIRGTRVNGRRMENGVKA